MRAVVNVARIEPALGCSPPDSLDGTRNGVRVARGVGVVVRPQDQVLLVNDEDAGPAARSIELILAGEAVDAAAVGKWVLQGEMASIPLPSVVRCVGRLHAARLSAERWPFVVLPSSRMSHLLSSGATGTSHTTRGSHAGTCS